jgi:DNA-binding GntR family transcriptional regulator
MDDAAIDELAGQVAEMDVAARAGDADRLAEADARFHGRIVELAGNGALAKVWRSLEPFSRTYLTLIAPGADLAWSAELHAPILAAVRARDTDAVVAALERHFAEVSANMAVRLAEDTDGEDT